MADINFSTYHGCACGRPGQRVARRPYANTRNWEVDIVHTGSDEVHTNVMTLHQPAVLKDGTRWVPFDQR